MTMLKVVEILAQSEKSWEDAAQLAVQEAAKTVRNIKSIDLCQGDGTNRRKGSDHLLPGQRQDFLRDRGTIVPRRDRSDPGDCLGLSHLLQVEILSPAATPPAVVDILGTGTKSHFAIFTGFDNFLIVEITY
ncbi:MAG: dodecin family protein [Acidobacteriota bacterium]